MKSLIVVSVVLLSCNDQASSGHLSKEQRDEEEVILVKEENPITAHLFGSKIRITNSSERNLLIGVFFHHFSVEFKFNNEAVVQTNGILPLSQSYYVLKPNQERDYDCAIDIDKDVKTLNFELYYTDDLGKIPRAYQGRIIFPQ